MYKELDDKQVIVLAIDYVKMNQCIPQELKHRLEELGILQAIDIRGKYEEDTD